MDRAPDRRPVPVVRPVPVALVDRRVPVAVLPAAPPERVLHPGAELDSPVPGAVVASPAVLVVVPVPRVPVPVVPVASAVDRRSVGAVRANDAEGVVVVATSKSWKRRS